MHYNKSKISEILVELLEEYFGSNWLIFINHESGYLFDGSFERLELSSKICDTFKIGYLYLDLDKIKNFHDLVEHIYRMQYYHCIMERELKDNSDKFCYIAAYGYTYEVHYGKPIFWKIFYLKKIKGLQLIYPDICL